MRPALLATLLVALVGCRDDPPPAAPHVEARAEARAEPDSAGGGVGTTTADEINAEIDVIEGALEGATLP